MRLLAGIITISPGHDASYPWRQIGTSADAQAGRAGAEYYLSPAEKGGEPPGIWRGNGLADLGLAEGEVIDREVFERLYSACPGIDRRACLVVQLADRAGNGDG